MVDHIQPIKVRPVPVLYFLAGEYHFNKLLPIRVRAFSMLEQAKAIHLDVVPLPEVDCSFLFELFMLRPVLKLVLLALRKQWLPMAERMNNEYRIGRHGNHNMVEIASLRGLLGYGKIHNPLHFPG